MYVYKTVFTATTLVKRTFELIPIMHVSHTMVKKSKVDMAELSAVPSELWSTHKYDVGLMKDATPLVIHPKSDFGPCMKQYPLKREALEGIKPVFDSLLQAGVIIP